MTFRTMIGAMVLLMPATAAAQDAGLANDKVRAEIAKLRMDTEKARIDTFAPLRTEGGSATVDSPEELAIRMRAYRGAAALLIDRVAPGLAAGGPAPRFVIGSEPPSLAAWHGFQADSRRLRDATTTAINA